METPATSPGSGGVNEVWELSSQSNNSGSVSAKSDRDRRHSSSASSSSISANRDHSPASSNGRRTRPSVTSVASSLPTVREMHNRRTSSQASLTVPPLPHNASLTSSVDSEETVVSSKKVLTNFQKVAGRDPEIEARRLRKISRCNTEALIQKSVYKRLVDWYDTSYSCLQNQFLGLFLRSRRRPDLPSTDELVGLARHYYPARADLKVQVCDFGLGRAERNEICLGQIEDYWQTKPDWVDVRWIHAPLGLGLAHSSVEDIFLHDGQPGREFENGGTSGWPYLETEVLNIRSHNNFQEMRDVYLILSKLTELEEALDQSSFKNDENSSLQSDIEWRANHLAMPANYWNLVSSDMPWQLTEGLCMGIRGPTEGLQPISRKITQQTLCNHPFYRDCHLVRNIFRCFHRSDGILLTMSPMAGVNFVDQKLHQHLSEPVDAIFDNENASAPGYVFSAFADQGTSTWHRRTVEWFLTYLITEVGVTPHAHRQGFNAPDLNLAYQAVINDLKRRRYAPWRKDETVKLVRDYLACVDELTTVKLICEKQVELFKGMQQDVRKFEADDNRARKSPDFPQGESMHERVKWALNMVKSRHDTFERLLSDAKQSMKALFELRSIEQNELAIVSDSQNKAVLIFTGVTIVFLPLSFFTSYYGMNLSTIVNTPRTEGYFWRVCGSAALFIVLVVTLGASRHWLKQMWKSRRAVKHHHNMV
ncbi:MAG: hypothetical protein L6R40_000970 [Gallowayella cf. fulva]|nr:MAG: hypothetical protein L6R40_000970 [Xanthomendoza cf. fulva]